MKIVLLLNFLTELYRKRCGGASEDIDTNGREFLFIIQADILKIYSQILTEAGEKSVERGVQIMFIFSHLKLKLHNYVKNQSSMHTVLAW